MTEVLVANAPLLTSVESSTPAQQRLPSNTLGNERERDENQDAVGNCTVIAVRFHPGFGNEGGGRMKLVPCCLQRGWMGRLYYFGLWKAAKGWLRYAVSNMSTWELFVFE